MMENTNTLLEQEVYVSVRYMLGPRLPETEKKRHKEERPRAECSIEWRAGCPWFAALEPHALHCLDACSCSRLGLFSFEDVALGGKGGGVGRGIMLTSFFVPLVITVVF